VRKLLAVVAELEQRLDELFVRLRRRLDHRRLQAGVAFHRFEDGVNLRVTCLLARERRCIGKRGGQFIEEFFRHDPFHFLVAAAL
jgi:hypothetical protein